MNRLLIILAVILSGCATTHRHLSPNCEMFGNSDPSCYEQLHPGVIGARYEAHRLGAFAAMGRRVNPEYNLDTVTVHVHWTTAARLHAAYRKMGRKAPVGIAGGLTIADPQTGRCDVFAERPATTYGEGMLILGHEFAHCLFGQFHERPDMTTAELLYGSQKPTSADRQRTLRLLLSIITPSKLDAKGKE